MPTLDQALQFAMERHRAGALSEAEGIYRQILAFQPNHPDALYLLAEIGYRSGNHPAARAMVEQALAQFPQIAHFHNLHGNILLAQKEYAEAEAAILRALAIDPASSNSYTNLANLRLETGRLPEAITNFRQALNLDGANFPAQFGLGLALLRNGQSQDSAAEFRAALRLSPVYADAHYHLGLAHSALGEHEAALACAREALRLQPPLAGPHRLQGFSLKQLGRSDESIAAMRQSVRIVPCSGLLWNDLAVALCDLNSPRLEAEEASSPGWFAAQAALEESLFCAQQAVAHLPDSAEAHNNLGNSLSALKRPAEALPYYQRAMALNPAIAEIYVNLGNVYLALKQPVTAEEFYRRALALDSQNATSWHNLGGILTKRGAWDEGIQSYERAIALKPHFEDSYSFIALAYAGRGEFERSLEWHRRAVEISPKSRSAHWHLALALRLLGHHEEGVREYEWRFGWIVANRNFSRPRWDGSPIPGQTLLLHAEQGYGDTIQYVRYLAAVCAAAGAKRVIFACPLKLHRLLSHCEFSGVEVIPLSTWDESGFPPFDCHLPLMSIPLALNRFDPEPMHAPYLRADPQLQEEWRARLGPRRGLRVGLIWAGNPEHEQDRWRSIPFEQLQPLLAVQQVEFFSLPMERKEPPERLHEARVIDFSQAMTDFDASAAFAAEMDLIITVDTAAAHLAGALGRPVWLLNARVSDWRWGLQREQTPWYRTMRIFRQTEQGQWGPVVEGVREALSQRALQP